MKTFLATFMGSPESESSKEWARLDDASKRTREAAGMKGWMEWVQKNQSSIVHGGSPIGKTKRTDRRGVSDTKNQIAAFTIVQAPSHEAAAKLFENHPHFMIFPGDSVEVMECLPMPTMPKG